METQARSRPPLAARLRRLIPAAPQAGLGPLDLLATGLWFGILTGLVEMLGHVVARSITGRITYETLRTNWHHAWMIPVANLLVFGLAALLLLPLVAAVGRPRAYRLASYTFSLLAALAVAASIPGLHKLAVAALAIGSAYQLGRFVAPRPLPMRRLVRRSLPVLAIALAVLVAWRFNTVAGAERRTLANLPAARPDAPNVLLIVLDTVRADAMSPYGSKRDTTPNLARLAAEGVRFDDARSTAPWTLPSHASLFTGRWPHELSAAVGRPLDATHPTLAEALAARGYACGAFVANMHNCNAWYGLNRGFAHYEDHYENQTVTLLEILRSARLGRLLIYSKPGQKLARALLNVPRYVYLKNASTLNRDALAWIDGAPRRPFFLFLNYYDAHDRNVLPPDAARTFRDEGAAKQPRTPNDLIRDDYDDSLAFMDRHVARLLAELKRRGRMDDTIVVVASDHGETFGEHGLVGHGVSLYRPELHIPLIIHNPRRVPAGRTVAGPVSLREVAATIADLAGAPPFAGASLTKHWSDASPPSRSVLAEVDRSASMPPALVHTPAARGVMRSLTTSRHIYIQNGDGREELYDLRIDPGEANDLAGSPDREADLRRLREALRALTNQRPDAIQASGRRIDAEER